MCGRFTQKSERKIISLEFYVQDFASDVFINYNVAPGQDAGVIVRDDVYRYIRYRWGLIPFWAKDPTIGNRMINARAESVAEKPSFKRAFSQRRCLVPADGFYEWKKEGNFKRPYYIYNAKNKPMSFAGLWETWFPKEGTFPNFTATKEEPLHTFTIITTEANQKLQQLHDRMPVIIPEDKREQWLNSEASSGDLEELLVPLTASEIEFHEVSRMVNSPQNNSPQCIEPVEQGFL